MVMIDPEQLQFRQVSVSHKVVKLALPLFVAPVIREALVKAAELEVGDLVQGGMRRESHAQLGRGRIMFEWHRRCRVFGGGIAA